MLPQSLIHSDFFRLQGLGRWLDHGDATTTSGLIHWGVHSQICMSLDACLWSVNLPLWPHLCLSLCSVAALKWAASFSKSSWVAENTNKEVGLGWEGRGQGGMPSKVLSYPALLSLRPAHPTVKSWLHPAILPCHFCLELPTEPLKPWTKMNLFIKAQGLGTLSQLTGKWHAPPQGVCEIKLLL